MDAVGLVLALLGGATVLGLVLRARDGRFRPTRSAADRPAAAPGVGPAGAPADARRADVVVLGPDDLGAPLGTRATFVQLSSEVCAACRSTAVVLADVAAHEPGVVHVELDVAEHLDLVRRLDVLRTPTTVVLDATGAVVARTSGATDRPRALAALASGVVAVADPRPVTPHPALPHPDLPHPRTPEEHA